MMENFYHLSHVLELFAGIYFGGLALFEAIGHKGVKDLSKSFMDLQRDTNIAKIKLEQYVEVTIGKSYRDGFIAMLKFIRFWVSSGFMLSVSKKGINGVTKRMDKLVIENYLEKKYYPIFFFAGCLCLCLMLSTGLEETYKDYATFHPYALWLDKFMVFHIYFAVAFYALSYYFCSRQIRTGGYLDVSVPNILIAILFFVVGVGASFFERQFMFVYYPIKHPMFLIGLTMVVVVLPLIIFVSNTVWMVIQVSMLNLTKTWLSQKVTEKADDDISSLGGK